MLLPGTARRKPKRGRALPSCTKHGPYSGPYCPQCYEKAMGGTSVERLDNS